MARLVQIGKSLVGLGFAQGLEDLPGLEFNLNKPFRCCCICGALRQTEADRTANTVSEIAQTAWIRQRWAVKHAKTHSIKEHELFKLSGLVMTPEAAKRLVAFGVVSIGDAIRSPEISRALFESSPIPDNDAES